MKELEGSTVAVTGGTGSFGSTIARDLLGRGVAGINILSRDEAKQVAASVTGFFAILAEWSRANMPKPANDDSDVATCDDEGAHDDC